MYLFQIFLILMGIITLTSLVKAKPLPIPFVASTKTGTFEFDSAFGSKAATIAEEEIEDGNHSEATCVDLNDCYIVDFTDVSCDKHTQPTCDANGCDPIHPTIEFSYRDPGIQNCINLLDKNGNPTICNKLLISHCTKQIKSIHLYAGKKCEESNWNQVNIAACYTSGGGIGSFKIIAVSGHKRDLLGNALMDESDPLSTSEYPLQGNVASVTPAKDCFDEGTGTYILGCKIERGVAPAPLPDFIPASLDHA